MPAALMSSWPEQNLLTLSTAGSVAAAAGNPTMARLVACLALKTASSSAAAQASHHCVRAWPCQAPSTFHLTPSATCCPAMQTTVVLHVCRHADAYLALLLPHAASPRVAALLSMLASCGCDAEAGVLADSASALSYLRLLIALAEQLDSSVAADGLSEDQAGLLAAALTSAVHALAAVKAQARQAADATAAGATNGRKRQSGVSKLAAASFCICSGCPAHSPLIRQLTGLFAAELLCRPQKCKSPPTAAGASYPLMRSRQR